MPGVLANGDQMCQDVAWIWYAGMNTGHTSCVAMTLTCPDMSCNYVNVVVLVWKQIKPLLARHAIWAPIGMLSACLHC